MVEGSDSADFRGFRRRKAPAQCSARPAFVVCRTIQHETASNDRSGAIQRKIRVVKDGVHLGESGQLTELGAQVADGKQIRRSGTVGYIQ